MIAGTAPCQAAVERHVFAMGTTLSVEVHAPTRELALAASEKALRAAAEVERRLSVWRTDSDIARINAAGAGEAVRVDPATIEDLRWAFALATRTGFAFDPTVGPLVEAYGLREGGRWPGEGVLRAAQKATGVAGFRFGAASIERCREHAALDCDAFGKGLALDRATAAARTAGATAVRLDFGGQIALDGGDELWVPIAHPLDRERIVAEVLLAPGWSASTSGNGQRREIADGRRVPHLLDPRSGQPAPDFGAVTVLARGAALADAASTACFVLGPTALPRACADLGVEAVVVELHDATVRLRATRGLLGRVRAAGGSVSFTFPTCRSKA
ncbi:MAG TPA: FAD:protein FMN transferase [Planctomycetota bacterium]|nr:FAD:protein FMN transferase [Planctomycetota bacterium]